MHLLAAAKKARHLLLHLLLLLVQHQLLYQSQKLHLGTKTTPRWPLHL
jgi:hypothetical protein